MLEAALETSPADFAEAYAQYAAQGLLLPQPEGSPLLEFACGGLVIYLLDRCGPYLPTGPGRVIVHGLINPQLTSVMIPGEPEQTWAEAVGRSALRGMGQVIAQNRRVTVVDAGLPLVLSRPALPPYPRGCWRLDAQPGDWVHFETLSPLHGFVL